MATRYGVEGRRPNERSLRVLLKAQPHYQLAKEAKERFDQKGYVDVIVREAAQPGGRRTTR
jgi:hypothetical protein